MFVTIEWAKKAKKRTKKLRTHQDWRETIEEWVGQEIVSCSANKDGSPPIMRTKDTKIKTKYRPGDQKRKKYIRDFP